MFDNTTRLICAGLILLGTAINADAAYVSTFDVAGDFSLTGFSNTASSPPTATDTAIDLDITNPTGSYTLQVPPPGSYSWFVSIENLALDLYGDSTPEFTLGPSGPHFIGIYDTPVPGLTGSYSFGDSAVPSDTLLGLPVGGYTLVNLTVDWTITMDGTDITEIDLLIDADNIGDLNTDITNLDNFAGGANGIIDGHATASFSVTAVPEPATLLLMGAGVLGLGAWRRRR